VDLFFYREPEETEKPAAEDAAGERQIPQSYSNPRA
jgi:hypothetical protein